MFRRKIISFGVFFTAFITLAHFRLPHIESRTPHYTLYSSEAIYSHPINTLPQNDYQHLIDINNFTFPTINSPCKTNQAPLLLIMIHSNPKNIARRRILRETWAKSTSDTKVLFIMGLPSNDLKSQILTETQEYNDIIQGNFIDSYRNMTYKHVALFKYVIYHCPQAKYVLKTDDDVFVNIEAVRNFLKKSLSPYGSGGLVFCNSRPEELAVRSWRVKWRLSFEEYPEKKYPPYCPGWVVLYSADTVFELYEEAQKSRYLWTDDLFITGVLANRLQIGLTNCAKFVLGNWRIGLLKTYTIKQKFLFAGPDIEDADNYFLLDYVNNFGNKV